MAEESNGDVLDSWEEFEDTGDLDRKLEEMKLKESKRTNDAIVLDDSNRTQYAPQVRILKRKSDAQSSSNQDSRSNKPPTKSLEQREAEYAEARRRILGTEKTDDTPNNKPPRLLQAEAMRQNMNNNCVVEILRQPRGPDGTSGFDQNG